MAESLILYAVRNQEEKWFRAVGRGGQGDSWVPELQKARLYSKIGQARGRVTYFVNNWPKFGVPDIVELTLGGMRVLDETVRVKEATDAIARRDAARQEAHAAWELEQAQLKLKAAKLAIARLKATKAKLSREKRP